MHGVLACIMFGTIVCIIICLTVMFQQYTATECEKSKILSRIFSRYYISLSYIN